MTPTDLQRKLRFAGLPSVKVVAAPRGTSRLVAEVVGDSRRARGDGWGVIAFARGVDDLDRAFDALGPFVVDDRPSWVAYPKLAGGMRSDLSRDLIAGRGRDRAMKAVAQVALDDTWSAIRFRAA